jgi:beta-glucanase (GH16 family)
MLTGIPNIFNDLLTGWLANQLTAIVSALLMIFNVHPINTDTEPIDLKDYRLVFADEFDGEALDTDVWGIHNSEGRRKGGYWSLDQAQVRDGNLVIRTEYLENGKFGKGWYTCGLNTKKSFNRRYGYYECRCILPKGHGLWSAFWLTNPEVSKVTGTAVNGAEIDIFESPYYFLPGKASYLVTSNIHYNGYDLQTRYKNVAISRLDNNPYENFNTYGMLWTEDEYIFYINGYEVGRSTYGGVSQAEEFMILSCEVDGAAATPTNGWSGNIKHNGGNSFTAEFIVDYVRVYS